ncbi:MAG: FAD-dependent oxidoreductase [Bradymonadales bacterium]|jgi:NADPH-dependent 2,4-dienoyl-CoA reductase/sulfur reductase-like enzyme
MLNQLKNTYDLVVIGGGPAGMAAAISAQEAGIESILIVERDDDLGGILLQCIHAGFGLHVFREELTGPEYAHRYLMRVIDEGIDYVTRCFVTDAFTESGSTPIHHLQLRSERFGLAEITAKAVILAMGCRERTRQAIHIPGSRPSGVMTAGLAQKMVNIHHKMPGKRVVILGSGDIGLIMARRLALEGAEVLSVYELMPYSNGLTRNIVQCLEDYDIPLHLQTTVTRIYGSKRLESVDVAPVDENGAIISEKTQNIACDTLLLSIGLIPEIEIARMFGCEIHPTTQGPSVNSSLETTTAGVFACGNVLHVHDLADNVSLESERAGKNAAAYLQGKRKFDDIKLVPGNGVRYCVPHSLRRGQDQIVSLRVTKPMQNISLRLGNVYERKIGLAIPSEMIHLKVPASKLEAHSEESIVLESFE